MAEKHRYEMQVGTHYEPNPDFQGTGKRHPDSLKKYVGPAVIESERPLDQIFPNKFRKVINGQPVVVTEERRQKIAALVAAGHWGEDDVTFLETLAEVDFQRVLKRAGASEKKQPTEDRKKATSILGEDVTDAFQRAYDEGFKVWRNPAGKHQVTRGTGTAPLNKKPLEAEEVDKFVGQYLKESK